MEAAELRQEVGRLRAGGGDGGGSVAGRGGAAAAGLDIGPLVCPLSGSIMAQPVTALDGHAYERTAIEEWWGRHGSVSPVTGKKLTARLLLPAHGIRAMIASMFPEHAAAAAARPPCWVRFLPQEALVAVLDFLGPAALATATAVCREWRLLASRSALWHRHLLADFPAVDCRERDTLEAVTSLRGGLGTRAARVAHAVKEVETVGAGRGEEEEAEAAGSPSALGLMAVYAQVRGPTTWTIIQKHGPNHLGIRYNVLPAHQMALINSGCVPSSVSPPGRWVQRGRPSSTPWAAGGGGAGPCG